MKLSTSVNAVLDHEEVQQACAEYMERHGLTGATSQAVNVQIAVKNKKVTAVLQVDSLTESTHKDGLTSSEITSRAKQTNQAQRSLEPEPSLTKKTLSLSDGSDATPDLTNDSSDSSLTTTTQETLSKSSQTSSDEVIEKQSEDASQMVSDSAEKLSTETLSKPSQMPESTEAPQTSEPCEPTSSEQTQPATEPLTTSSATEQAETKVTKTSPLFSS